MRLRANAANRSRRRSPERISAGWLMLSTALMAGCPANQAAGTAPSIPVIVIEGQARIARRVESRGQECREPKDPKPGEKIPDCALKREFVEGDDVEFTAERRRRLRQIQDMYAKCHVRIQPEIKGPNVKGYWVTLERYGADEEALDGDWISYVETGVNIHYVASMDIKVSGSTGFLPYNTLLQSRLYEFQRSNPELSLLLRFDNNRLSSMGIAPIYSLEPDPMLKAWIDYVRTGIRPVANP